MGEAKAFGRVRVERGPARTDLEIQNVAVPEEAVNSVKGPTHAERAPGDNNRAPLRRRCDDWQLAAALLKLWQLPARLKLPLGL